MGRGMDLSITVLVSRALQIGRILLLLILIHPSFRLLVGALRLREQDSPVVLRLLCPAVATTSHHTRGRHRRYSHQAIIQLEVDMAIRRMARMGKATSLRDTISLSQTTIDRRVALGTAHTVVVISGEVTTARAETAILRVAIPAMVAIKFESLYEYFI